MNAPPTASAGVYTTRALVNDNPSKRLLVGVIVSIFANIFLWAGASQAVRFTPRRGLTTVEITRVIINKQGHKIEKIVTKKEIEKKVAEVKKKIERLVPAEAETAPPQPKPITPPPPKPQGAHNRLLTAPPSPNDAKLPDDTPTVLAGGNAAVGTVIAQQNRETPWSTHRLLLLLFPAGTGGGNTQAGAASATGSSQTDAGPRPGTGGSNAQAGATSATSATSAASTGAAQAGAPTGAERAHQRGGIRARFRGESGDPG